MSCARAGNRFARDYEAATLYSVVHEEPEALPDGVPAELQRVVFKCLEKEVNNRYQSAEELLVDLRQIQRKQVSHEFTDDKSHRTAKKRMLLPATVLGVVILAMTQDALIAHDMIGRRVGERRR